MHFALEDAANENATANDTASSEQISYVKPQTSSNDTTDLATEDVKNGPAGSNEQQDSQERQNGAETSTSNNDAEANLTTAEQEGKQVPIHTARAKRGTPGMHSAERARAYLTDLKFSMRGPAKRRATTTVDTEKLRENVSRTNKRFWSEYRTQMHENFQDTDTMILHMYFAFGAVLVGLVSAGFAKASEQTEAFFKEYNSDRPELIWLTLPVGLPLVLAMTRLFFDGTAGSGIPLEMGTLFLVSSDPNFIRVFSLNIIIGKIGLTLLVQLCGASAGREGPTVQVASSIFVLLLQLAANHDLPVVHRALKHRTSEGDRLFENHLQDAIVAGGASGIAGAFQAPLGGIIFAIEEMGNRYTKSLGKAMIICVAVSGAVAIVLLGFHPIFADFDDDMSFLQYLIVVPCVSIPAGVLGGFWSLILFFGVRMKQARIFSKLPMPYLVCCICGFGIAMCGYWTDGETYGSGVEMSAAVFEPKPGEDEDAPGLSYGALKMAATWLTYWSGAPGGVFAPSISVGAGWGRCFYRVAIELGADIEGHEPAMAYVTTTAYFAGVTQSPITAVAILMGMLECKSSIVPAMFIASIIGWSSSRLISPKPLYGALASLLISPLPPENLQPNLRKLPKPRYHKIHSGAGKNRLFIELSEQDFDEGSSASAAVKELHSSAQLAPAATAKSEGPQPIADALSSRSRHQGAVVWHDCSVPRELMDDNNQSDDVVQERAAVDEIAMELQNQ